jgi:hypothetical protein
MKKYLALGAALLAVSACDNSGGGGNETKEGGNAAASAQGASGGSAAPAAPAASSGGGGSGNAGSNETIQPGLYEVTMQMSMTAPNMPQGVNPNQPPRTQRECITPEETREMADTFAEQPEGMQCSERQFTMRGGNMEGRMTCRGQGGEFRIRMAGSYTGNSFNFRQEMAGTMPGASQPMNMQVQAQGRRVGECPAGEEDGDSGGSGNQAAGE